jgi:competence protein ComEA
MRRALAALVCTLALPLGVARADEPAARAEEPPACTCPEPAEAVAATIDLNRADEGALLALPGIGPSRAKAILAYREAHGGFRNLSQLLNIKGIGRSLLRQLRPLVTLSPG